MVGKLEDFTAGKTIDAAGLVVSPGFINESSRINPLQQGGGDDCMLNKELCSSFKKS